MTDFMAQIKRQVVRPTVHGQSLAVVRLARHMRNIYMPVIFVLLFGRRSKDFVGTAIYDEKTGM